MITIIVIIIIAVVVDAILMATGISTVRMYACVAMQGSFGGKALCICSGSVK